MDHQTEVNYRNSSQHFAPQSMSRGLGQLAHDVLTLAELQGQLVMADFRECGRRTLVPALSLLAGLALGLACLPIALAALALFFIDTFATSNATGCLVALGVAAIPSTLLCVIGWIQLRRRLAVTQRSRQELVRNLRWIKTLLSSTRVIHHE